MSFCRSASPALMTLLEYAPASPRSEVISRIAERFGFSTSTSSGCSMSCTDASAETALVSVSVYGTAALATCCALTMRDAAMSSMARVIFFVVETDCFR